MAKNYLRLFDYTGTDYGLSYSRDSDTGEISYNGTLSGSPFSVWRQRIGACYFEQATEITVDA